MIIFIIYSGCHSSTCQSKSRLIIVAVSFHSIMYVCLFYVFVYVFECSVEIVICFKQLTPIFYYLSIYYIIDVFLIIFSLYPFSFHTSSMHQSNYRITIKNSRNLSVFYIRKIRLEIRYTCDVAADVIYLSRDLTSSQGGGELLSLKLDEQQEIILKIKSIRRWGICCR